jgi:hypothetical protein
MDVIASGSEESADRLTERLAKACGEAGLKVTVIEPSTRLKVHALNGNEHLDEVITLRPDPGEVLTWYWSWDEPAHPAPIAPAHDVATAARLIRHVVAAGATR